MASSVDLLALYKLKCVKCEWKAAQDEVSDQFLKTLNKQCANFIFLQGTPLTIEEHTKLGCQWMRQVFFSSFSLQARGVVTLISNKVPFQQDRVIEDGGSYVMVKCFL